MYAAEEIVAALKRDEVDFSAYDERVRKSVDRQGPLQVAQHAPAVLQGLLRRRRDRQRDDRSPRASSRAGMWKQEPDAEEEMVLGDARQEVPEARRQAHLRQALSVFASGNATRDDAPNHIRIQNHVPREVAQTWVSMCPAQVYEIPEEQLANGAAEVDVHVVRLELRPVRRDHRQGRAPDAARGRRRAALPGGLTKPGAPRTARVVLRDGGRRSSARSSRPIASATWRASRRPAPTRSSSGSWRRSCASRESQLRYLLDVDHRDHEALLAIDEERR